MAAPDLDVVVVAEVPDNLGRYLKCLEYVGRSDRPGFAFTLLREKDAPMACPGADVRRVSAAELGRHPPTPGPSFFTESTFRAGGYVQVGGGGCGHPPRCFHWKLDLNLPEAPSLTAGQRTARPSPSVGGPEPHRLIRIIPWPDPIIGLWQAIGKAPPKLLLRYVPPCLSSSQSEGFWPPPPPPTPDTRQALWSDPAG